MTIDEAREYLYNLSYQLGSMAMEYLSDKDGEKMREAIKALESQSNTPERDNSVLERVGDCVSREEVMKLLEKEDWADTVYGVQALPTVQPQPKTGHWEDCSNGWMCSNCNRDVTYESDFCPNCGADMRETEVEDKRACERCIHYVTRDSRGVVLCGCDGHECYFEEVKT